MLTPTDRNQAITAADELARETLGEAIARRKRTGWRYLCSFCQRDLPGSNPDSTEISHGMCKPLCANAIALGWSNPKPPVPTPADPLAPLFQLL